jgi:hypothetical protein
MILYLQAAERSGAVRLNQGQKNPKKSDLTIVPVWAFNVPRLSGRGILLTLLKRFSGTG